MIRFLEYTDQQYSPGEVHDFGKALEELYVARRVAVYVTPDDAKQTFEDRQDKSVKADDRRVKRKA